MTTEKPSSPRPPAGLGDAGKALWRALVGAYLFSPAELQVLALAARQLDDVAALERSITAAGMTVEGSAGQQRLNAAVTEVRQSRLAAGKLIGQLNLPDEADRAMSPASKQASKAAASRWKRTAELRGARRGDAQA